MNRVTLDTNEWVSAFNGGRAGRLLRMAIDGDIEIAVSEPIIDETIRVLRQKFGWRPYDLHDAWLRMRRIGRMVEPKQKLSVLGDEPDNRIIECAAEAGSEWIVPEDKAMLRRKEYGGVRIMRLTDLLSLLKIGRGK